MKEYCYKDGKVVKLKNTGLALNDIGVLRGYAVFDFMRVYNGKPFHLKEHLARFKRGLKHLRLNIKIDEKEIEKIIAQLLKKNKCQNASVRLVVTGGASSDGFSFSKQVFYILMADFINLPKAVYESGGKIITHSYERQFPELKTTNYATAIYLQDKIKKAGAIEVLYIDKDNTVKEAATSNIFMFKGNNLITTKDGILKGITGQQVIKLAKKHFKVVEKNFKLKDLLQADEVFLTATNKLVAPIVKIDSRRIASGKVGPKTKVLMKELNSYIARHVAS